MSKSTNKILDPTLYQQQSGHAISKKHLLQRLKKLSIYLGDLNQKPSELPNIKKVSLCLIKRWILKHKSKDIVLLAACCLCDILRIYAPNPPFNNSQLKTVFDIFLIQMEGLGNPESLSFPQRFHLLESLAIVNSCLILVEFEDKSLLCRLFNLFFSLMNKSVSRRIELYMLDIMVACITECEIIPEKVLHSLLCKIIHPAKEKHSDGYRLALRLIDRGDINLEQPIISFIKKMLVRGESKEFEEFEEEESDDFSILKKRASQLDVIYEIAIHKPKMVISLLPDLQNMARVEDPLTRLEYVIFFGKMFIDAPKLAETYLPLFQEFLRRFEDINPTIRSKMCHYGEYLLVQQEKHRDIINKTLSARAMDRDDKIRKVVISSVCNAAVKDAESVSLELLSIVSNRLMDKKMNVRCAALEGMARLFKLHCSEYWKCGNPMPKSSKKFIWIPRKLVAASTLNNQTKLLVERLLDEVVLGSAYSVDERTRCIIGIFASCDNHSRNLLLSFINTKYGVQECVRQLFQLQNEIQKDPNNLRITKKRMARLTFIAKKFQGIGGKLSTGDESKSMKQLINIFTHKNKNIRKWLLTLSNPISLYSDLRIAQNEFVRTLHSEYEKPKKVEKTNTIVFHLSKLIALTLLPIDCIPMILSEASSNAKKGRVILGLAALELALGLFKVFPQMVSHSIDSFPYLIELLLSSSSTISNIALQILATCKNVDKLNKKRAKQLLNILEDFALNGTNLEVRYAVRAIKSLFNKPEAIGINSPGKKSKKIQNIPESKQILSFILENSLDKLNKENDKLSVVLSTMGEIAIAAPLVFQENSKIIVKFINDLLMVPSEHLNLITAKISGVECLTKYILSLKNADNRIIKSIAVPIIRTMMYIIKSNTDNGEEKLKDSKSSTEKHSNTLVGKAAESVVSMCSIPLLARMIMYSPQPVKQGKAIVTYAKSPFLMLALVAHHETPNVRHSFVLHVFERLKDDLPFSFCIILAFCASYKKEMLEKMKLALRNLIVSQREKVKLHQQIHQQNDEGANTFPEYTLAHFIYTLSYHPDFNDVCDNENDSDDVANVVRVYSYFMRFCKFFLDCLLPRLTPQDHNFSLILHITNCIKNSQDVRNSSNTKIYKLAEMIQLYLRHLYQGRDWSGSKYPGKLTLPTNMYIPRTTAPKPRYLPSFYQPYPAEETGGDVGLMAPGMQTSVPKRPMILKQPRLASDTIKELSNTQKKKIVSKNIGRNYKKRKVSKG